MITAIVIGVIVSFLASVFSIFGGVEKLPTIGDFDIDTALVTGMGQFKHFMADVWVLQYVFQGLGVLIVYYGAKMILKVFLGSRAPGSYY